MKVSGYLNEILDDKLFQLANVEYLQNDTKALAAFILFFRVTLPSFKITFARWKIFILQYH